MPFDATLASSPLACRFENSWLPSTRKASPQSPLLERLDPSAFPDPDSPSFHSSEKERLQWVPPTRKVPTLGFGYPFVGVSHLDPWKPLSAPNALGLRSSKLFSSSVILPPFPVEAPLWRFPNKPKRPVTGASAAFAHRVSRAPLCPQWFRSGRDRLLP
jgi:hypothetical protein